MSLEEMKGQSFPHYSFDEWKDKAEESLKGKALESLKRTTYENIVLKPLYTYEDEKALSEFPGSGDYRRGTDSLGYVHIKWKVAQSLSYKTADELKEKLKNAVESGQTAISFELSKELIKTKDAFLELVRDYSRKLPFAVQAKEFHGEVLSTLENITDGAEVTGYIACDPLSSVVVTGSMPDNFTEQAVAWSETIKKAHEKFPNLQTVLVDTTPYHNGGASAVQELGIAAATGVFYLQSISGLELEQVLDKMIFKFSIGADFFMEIAKLRAARILWNKITEVFGAKEPARGMKIASETSSFTKTVFDPYVNILRGGTEAFAAVVGGVQYLQVNAFDELTGASTFSERIARNTQLILEEEAHMTKVIDPAGGSWYVEELTRELAEKAWAFFQEIEANGGIVAAIKTNWLQEKVAAVYEKRQQDVFTRKRSIIGTNVYANLDDAVPDFIPAAGGKSGEADIQSIPQLRLAQPYEELRIQAEALKQKSATNPHVALICLGSLKQYKARMDFVRGFLSAGGVTVSPSEPINTVEEAQEFAANSKTKYFCICGTNEQYETLGLNTLQALKAEFADRHVFLAGLPDKEDQAKWMENGLKQFIHVKSNCFETLSVILTEMEVSLNEQVQA